VERVATERPHTDRPKILVAHGDRLGGAPLVIELLAAREEIDGRHEWRFERLVPVEEVGEDREVLRLKRVESRPKSIGQPALVQKGRHLRLANSQFSTVHDLAILHRKPPSQKTELLCPINNGDELFESEIENAHKSKSPSRTSRR
jgi:hypothetical protein